MELTNRKKRILRAIVEIYIATAEPALELFPASL